MHKEGNKNVLWEVMGQRYMLRSLADKARGISALQERHVSSPVRSSKTQRPPIHPSTKIICASTRC